MIRAECHSDDRVVEVEFDATPWFQQASDKSIIELAEIDWGLDYASDDVAEKLAESNEEIAEMFKYISIVQRTKHMGFECTVNEDDALKWIAENRPTLTKEL